LVEDIMSEVTTTDQLASQVFWFLWLIC
jgi:hypothetical protein